MAKTDKTDKKIKKVDKKTGRKCGALLAFLALAAMLCGCAQTGSQPSRSQTMNNDIHDCTFVMASEAVVSNGVVIAKNGDASGSEMFTQTMKNEGNEQNTPTATPTLDIKPQTTLNYGLTSGSTAGNDWIDSLSDLTKKGLSAWLRSGNANGTMVVTKKDGTTETVTCKDGVCTTQSGECVTCQPSSSGSTCSDCQLK